VLAPKKLQGTERAWETNSKVRPKLLKLKRRPFFNSFLILAYFYVKKKIPEIKA